jgi:hypothetical protein
MPKKLIKLFIDETIATFGDRVVSLYAFGSLGEHGDFSLCSDVDVVLMLDKVVVSDQGTVKELWEKIKASELDYADRLSLFWSSYSGNDFARGVGRFPPLDRLDLIRHAKLLHGEDRRRELSEPSQQEMVLESARFITSFMLADGKDAELTENAGEILAKGSRYFTKFVLFPVRLLFTVANEKTIASNKEAVAYFNQFYKKEMPKEVYELVNFAYTTRSCPAYVPVIYDEAALKSALLALYQFTIRKYLEAVAEYDDAATKKQLSGWLQKID